MNASRTRGGLALVPKDNGARPIEIRLVPLTRVKGSLEGPAKGERPEWTFVYTLVPEDAERPLDTNRLAGCGSYEARFEMALPPGRYSLNAYTFKGDEKADVVPDREVVVTGKVPVIDLGVLQLSSFKPTITARKERAKTAGTWSDYTKHYGDKPPAWHVVDARGVKKDVQIADFRGKWVLVDFWGLSCRPCLERSMPKLMKFYDAHRDQRDQFEILAICIDEDGELQSIDDIDKKLRPIVEHVWGRTLPFPVLLDPTFTTWERYGLPGLGTVVLIDPEGNLVKGDETDLAQKLKPRK
jgi:thiol-disulfide isomerase/thioredoxin